MLLAGCGAQGLVSSAPAKRQASAFTICGADATCTGGGGGVGLPGWTTVTMPAEGGSSAVCAHDSAASNYDAAGFDNNAIQKLRTKSSLSLNTSSYSTSATFQSESGTSQVVSYTAPSVYSVGQVDTIPYSNGGSAVRSDKVSTVLGHISAVATVASLLFMNPAFAIVATVTGLVGWFYGTAKGGIC